MEVGKFNTASHNVKHTFKANLHNMWRGEVLFIFSDCLSKMRNFFFFLNKVSWGKVDVIHMRFTIISGSSSNLIDSFP